MPTDIVLSEADIQRFKAKVDQKGPDECWPWLGGFQRGVGTLKINGRNRAARRVAYLLATGVQPGVLRVMASCETPLCTNPAHSFLGTEANIAGHAKRRFWANVAKGGADECWVWLGRVSFDGYGVFDIGGGAVGAHRYALQEAVGLEPGKPLAMHSCDAPPCCNPRHLSWGTSQDNVRDSTRKGRHSSVNLRGEDRPNARLTEAEVLEIRSRRALGETLVEIGQGYGIHHSTVRQITTRQTWTHI